MKAFSWRDSPHGAIVADGKRLEAAAFGPQPDEAPTIVLLHEGLGCVALWRDLPEKLAGATGCGVFVYSRAGYGRSDPIEIPRPPDYLVREAHVLKVVLGAIGFTRGILVGHSDGSSIAAIYAGMTGDERVRGLVLLAPHVIGENYGFEGIEEVKRAYASGEFRARLAKYHAHVDCAFLGWSRFWSNPGVVGWTIEDYVARWRVPALLIAGVDDHYFTLAQSRAIEARAPTPVERLDLRDCAHAPHFEQPQATLDAIAAFCKNRLTED